MTLAFLEALYTRPFQGAKPTMSLLYEMQQHTHAKAPSDHVFQGQFSSKTFYERV